MRSRSRGISLRDRDRRCTLIAAMQADEYALPRSHPLRAFVFGMWQLRMRGTEWSQRVLPRRVVNLMFPLEGTLTVMAGSQPRTAMRDAPFVAGLQSHTVDSKTDGALLIFGVSLRAHASRALFPLPAREVADLTIPSADVLAATAELFGLLHDAATFQDRCALTVEWLWRRVSPPHGLARVEHACAVISQSPDAAALDRAAASAGCTSRHLRRLFLDFVGATPADYLRLSRFARALRLMTTSGDLTDIAQAAGYYDQAHFCHDFRELSGLTPGAYRAQAGSVPGILFSSDVRVIQAPIAAFE